MRLLRTLLLLLTLTGLGLAQTPTPVSTLPPGTTFEGQAGQLEGITVSVGDLMARPELHSVMRKRFKKEPIPDLVEFPQEWASGQRPPTVIPSTTGDVSDAYFAIGSTFRGGLDSISSIPPDTHGAVGPTQVLVCTNERVDVFNKSGTLGALSLTLNGFFSTVGSGVFDPRAKYDRVNQRWYVIAVDGGGGASSSLLIAVSSGPTITAKTDFTFYSINASAIDPGNWFDYPIIGQDEDGLYVTTNNFGIAGDPFSTTVFSIRKSTLPGTLNYVQFTNKGNGGSHAPADSDQPGTSTAHLLNAGWSGGGIPYVRMYKINNPGSGAETFTLGDFVALNAYSQSGIGDVVPQLGSAQLLAGNDPRIGGGAVVKFNPISGTYTLTASLHYGPVALRSRFFEIENLLGTPSMRQQGNLGTGAGRSYWFPSVAVNGQGHMVLGSSAGDSGIYASTNVAARLASDGAGTLSFNSISYAGLAPYYKTYGGGSNRWGDYSESTVDPNDNQTFWTFQTYAETASGGWDRWGVRVVKLLSPPPATISSLSPNTISQGTTANITVTGTSSGGSAFYDPGAGFANRIAGAFSGSGLTVNSVTFTNGTSIVLNVSASGSATTGARNLTVTNPDGQTSTLNSALTVNASGASVTSLSPTNADAQTPGLTLRINGSGFTASSVGQWNNADRATVFVNSTALDMTVTPADLYASGVASVRASTSGTPTNALNFTVNSVTFSTAPTTFSLLRGLSLRANNAMLASSDDVRAQIFAPSTGLRNYDLLAEFSIAGQSNLAPSAALRLEHSSTLPNAATSTVVLQALNQTSGAWETVATGAGSASDTTLVWNTTSLNLYRAAGTNRVRVRVGVVGSGRPAPTQSFRIDQLVLRETY